MSFWVLLIFKQICVSRLIFIYTKIFPPWKAPKDEIQADLKLQLLTSISELKNSNPGEKPKEFSPAGFISISQGGPMSSVGMVHIII